MTKVFVDRSDAVNLARNILEHGSCDDITPRGVRILCEAVLRMDVALLTMSQPTEAALNGEDGSDPCPSCRKGTVCRTLACGRLRLPLNHPYRIGN